MGEQYEAEYYKSVTDDLRVSNERLNESVAELRHRCAVGDKAVELILLLLKALEDGQPIEDVTVKMHHFINAE
jgi:hypothetical protein